MNDRARTAQQHNAERFDLGQMVEDMAKTQTMMAKVAMDAVDRLYATAIKTLEDEFHSALRDPETKIRTSLQIAITNLIAISRASAANDYANAMVKKDQITRLEGK